ncbi:MAG: ABC transporter permease [Desulfovibrio sp.]|nr:ABC transporter permease [Desulfovibrio sp.]
MNTRTQVDFQHHGANMNIAVGGTWQLATPLPETAQKALQILQTEPITELTLTEENLCQWDSNLLVFLVQIVRSANDRKIALHLNLSPNLQRLIHLAFEVKAQEGSQRSHNEESFLAKIGTSVLNFFPKCADFFCFLTDVLYAFWKFFMGRACMRTQDFLSALHECSIEALPIVSITNLLFGLILAFVGAVQLTQFGAQIYVAGLVGIGMLRVMGAVMVGIVMSGRVGASYAALIGTMQVNEEVDALVTFGFSPIEFLVLPRMLALAIMAPILTLYADLMGIVGGFLVGTMMLNLNPLEYLNATCNMVNFQHAIIGLVYATMFGIVIAVSGCYHGIRCGRSAQAVGQATTTAVVHSIVGIIVMTALITIICNLLGV